MSVLFPWKYIDLCVYPVKVLLSELISPVNSRLQNSSLRRVETSAQEDQLWGKFASRPLPPQLSGKRNKMFI